MKMTLLPPKPGVCQKCAADHDLGQPHNQQSLYWQYWFYDKYSRWPTWEDAMAHCTDEVKQFWIDELKERGVAVIKSAASAKTTDE
ncbi:MAG: hypothetical protein ABF820_13525 [Sporolactobacillus sp.]